MAPVTPRAPSACLPQVSSKAFWTITPEWAGRRAIILAGGPTASGQIDSIKGELVIAINSAWETYPEADFLFFHDIRWWQKFGERVKKRYKGRVVSTARDLIGQAGILVLRRIEPPKIISAHNCVTMARTSTAGALHLGWHLGLRLAILCGADGQLAEDGRRHHHRADYSDWKFLKNSFKLHRDELATLAPCYKRLGMRVVNVSPRTTYDMFERMTLDAALALKIDTGGRKA